MKDFITAAFPWVAMGILLAVFFAGNTDEGNKPKENRAAEGMSVGMCLGTGIGVAIGAVSSGIMFGVLIGYIVGSRIPKSGQKPEK